MKQYKKAALSGVQIAPFFIIHLSFFIAVQRCSIFIYAQLKS
jgi:hypothetical protein